MKEKYSTEVKKDETDKLECNKLFTRFAVKHIGNACILDAITLMTTFWLTRRGFKNIFVPNPFCFEDIKNDTRITAINSLLGEFLKETKLKFTAMWLDYCSSFTGNVDIKPQLDIETIFERKLLKNNSTLAVTFAFRKHERVEYVGEDEDKVRYTIEENARLNGYTAVYQRIKRYKGMYFIIYKVYINK